MDAIKVAKFGGSSLRDAGRIRQVGEIVRNDPAIRFVVVSAPEGVTDLLLGLENSETYEEDHNKVIDRFFTMTGELGVDYGLISPDIEESRDLFQNGERNALVSRGEYICAKVVAAYLAFDFLDAARFMHFNERGEFDFEASKYAWNSLNLSVSGRYVVPGFYGAMPSGAIKLFSRNASDFSAAVVAACAGAALLEKWTNESGIRRADPRIVPDAEYIDEVTFREIRELTSRGTKILHPQVIMPLRDAKIPIEIKNVDKPLERGTRIVPNEMAAPKPPGTVVGISSRKGYTVFGIEKVPMETGFAAKLLGVFAELNVDVAHIVDGVDEMGIVVDGQELAGGKEGEIFARIKQVCKPDMINIDHGMSIVSVVGHWMDNAPGTAAKVLAAPARIGVSVEIIDQSKNQTNITLGVADRDCDVTVRAIYDATIR